MIAGFAVGYELNHNYRDSNEQEYVNETTLMQQKR